LFAVFRCHVDRINTITDRLVAGLDLACSQHTQHCVVTVDFPVRGTSGAHPNGHRQTQVAACRVCRRREPAAAGRDSIRHSGKSGRDGTADEAAAYGRARRALGPCLRPEPADAGAGHEANYLGLRRGFRIVRQCRGLARQAGGLGLLETGHSSFTPGHDTLKRAGLFGVCWTTPCFHMHQKLPFL
jgi:hypothetical protein